LYDLSHKFLFKKRGSKKFSLLIVIAIDGLSAKNLLNKKNQLDFFYV